MSSQTYIPMEEAIELMPITPEKFKINYMQYLFPIRWERLTQPPFWAGNHLLITCSYRNY